MTDYGRVDNDDGYEFNTYISNLIGNVDVGITDINQVSHLVSENEHLACDCHICLDEVKMPRKLLCNHVFCNGCISQWLHKNKKCPVCRLDLEVALKEDEKFEEVLE
jgi:alkyl hydroperoxide reductase subunit AhpF